MLKEKLPSNGTIRCQTTTDFTRIRSDFPISAAEVHPGVKLVYLDSTASSQKPNAVIEAMDRYYRTSNANIHRGVHTLAEEATALYEARAQRIAAFIGAKNARRGNLYPQHHRSRSTWWCTPGRARILNPGDLVLLTEMEHHSNIVPWQMLAAERGMWCSNLSR